MASWALLMAQRSPAISQRAQATLDPSPAPGNSSAGPVHALPRGLTSGSAVTSTASTSTSLSTTAFETLRFLRFGDSSFYVALGLPWPTMGLPLIWQLTRHFLQVQQALPLPPIGQLQASFRCLQLSQGVS